VAAERIALREPMVVEVVLRIMTHAELFHYARRTMVGRHRKREDLAQTEYHEPDSYRRLSGFCHKPATPMFRWDIAVLASGAVVIATDHNQNNPALEHRTV
jgi:hypothetical protein